MLSIVASVRSPQAEVIPLIDVPGVAIEHPSGGRSIGLTDAALAKIDHDMHDFAMKTKVDLIAADTLASVNNSIAPDSSSREIYDLYKVAANHERRLHHLNGTAEPILRAAVSRKAAELGEQAAALQTTTARRARLQGYAAAPLSALTGAAGAAGSGVAFHISNDMINAQNAAYADSFHSWFPNHGRSPDGLAPLLAGVGAAVTSAGLMGASVRFALAARANTQNAAIAGAEAMTYRRISDALRHPPETV